MKRSEMVKQIALQISILKGGPLPSHKDELIASAILKTIEDLGMKPPNNPQLLGNDFEAIRNTFHWEAELSEKL